MVFRIEQRIGIAAPVDDVYDIVADINAWPSWSPIHKVAEAELKFGAAVALEEYYEGLGTWEIRGSLSDWTPLSHLHVWVPKPFYAGRLIRFFEFDTLTGTSSTFAIGAVFSGFLSEREGRRIAGPVRRGFKAMAEALKDKAETAYAARPKSEAPRLPPGTVPTKLQPPPRPNWGGPKFLGQRKK